MVSLVLALVLHLVLALVLSPCYLSKHGPNHAHDFGRVDVGVDSGNSGGFGGLYVPVGLSGTNFRGEQQATLEMGVEGVCGG